MEDEFDEDELEPTDEEELDEELEDDVDLVVDEEGDLEDSEDGDADPEAEEPEQPSARRKRPAADDDEEDDEEYDPDEVEADLDAILKDRIAATPDDEEEDEDEAPTTADDGATAVAAKSADEFTCSTCFMIVHPRQFGRRDNLVCPEGYPSDECSSIPIVLKRLNASAKK